ncbi:MAG: hypothetical protein J2P37_10410, partial [Ktedonobacteraceae bacterium]|nr:hypothetical protein [Ktedonobacteraceae bacterium]
DRISGEVISEHYPDGERLSGFTFDPTSTFVAGITGVGDSRPVLKVWRLDPAEHFIPPPLEQFIFPHGAQRSAPDQVYGKMALSMLHWNLDVPQYYNGCDGVGLAVFSPDSHKVVFCLPVDRTTCMLTAYEVISGRRLWCTYKEGGSLSPFVFTPDGKALICSNVSSYWDGGELKKWRFPEFVSSGSELLVYRISDGEMVQRLPSGRSSPIDTLAFDHDGTTLWLLTDEKLVSYQLPSAYTT